MADAQPMPAREPEAPARKRPVGAGFLIEGTAPAEVFTAEDLTEEQKMIGQVARDFALKEVRPLIDELEHGRHEHSVALLRRAGELGLLAVEIPTEYEGLGLDKATATLVVERLAPAGSFGVTFGAHTGIGTLPIVYFGTPEQKRRYLPKLATGEWIAAYALTEPDAGSDALGGKTRAVLSPDGKHYVLSGQKQWITNSGFAHVFVVYAKVDGEKMTAFIVERDFPGVAVSEEVRKMGIKGSSTRTLYLNDVPVPVENVLGEVGKGHHIAFNILNIGRWKLAAGNLGACKELIAVSTQYAQGRKQFGRPIADFPLIQQKLAAMAARTYALEAMVYRTAGAFDASLSAIDGDAPDAGRQAIAAISEYAVEASINKVFGSETLDFVVDEAVQIHGGYGYMQEYEVERAYRDARINRIFEGTNEINRLLIPRELMRRTLKGKLPLMQALGRVQKELAELSPLGPAGEAASGPLADEQALIANARRLTLMVAGLAVQRYMQQLEHEQELLAAIADLCIELYAMESAVLRALKAGGTGIHADLARLFVAGSLDRVEIVARNALAAIERGDALQVQLGIVRRLLRREPVNQVALGRQVARAVLEAGGYPLGDR